MDYSKLNEITVKSQAELDAIPLDFKGRIYIEFGTSFNRAIIKNSYYLRPVLRENSSAVLRENSSAELWGNSSAVLRENSSAELWENSSAVLRGNSSAVLRENSSADACGNAQVNQCSDNAKIKISGNARIVYNPKNINDFIDFYGIKHTKTKATLYKAVHKRGNKYVSDYNESFEYIIGEVVKEPNIDLRTDKSCGTGIHISHLNWALNFGESWEDLAILEIETKISDIVCPENTDGKVRTSRAKVIREVPLEECGILGKILAKRLNK